MRSLLTLSALLALSASAQTAFVPLNYLDGYGPTSEAYAVSADGSRIVGYSTSSLTSNLAVWWTGAGIAALPGTQNWYNNNAVTISADSSLIAGFNSWGGTENAFYWTAEAGTAYLDFPPPPFPATDLRASVSWAVSANAKVIVGSVTYTRGTSASATRYPRSFIWYVGDATATLLSQFPGDFKSDTALGVNQDGSLVVGTAFTSLTTQTAVFWNAAGGPFALNQPGDTVVMVSANDVTPDGSVIVGSGVDAATGKGVAFKWTAATGPVALPAPTTGVYAYNGLSCFSVSGDGRVVVGYGENVVGQEEAVFWVDEQPYRVSDVAFAAGVLPPSWEPFRAYGTDFYGNTICGQGRATSGKIEGFVLVLDTTPDPPAVVAPTVSPVATAPNGDLTVRYMTRTGLRYRVIGGSHPGELSPLNDWQTGFGFETDFIANAAADASSNSYFLSVEARND